MKISQKLILKFLSIFSIILLTKVTPTKANCMYPQHLLDREWRLLIKYHNDSLGLLRNSQIEDNSILYLVCNNNDEASTEVSCENGGFNPQLEIAGCAAITPQLKLENNKNLCKFNLYKVGFQIRCRNINYFFESYKVCFDFEQKRAVFAINEAHPFVKSRPFGMQFDRDEIFTNYIFAAYNKRDIYETFKKILGAGQTYMPPNAGDERFDRGHLTPAGDYMTNTLIGSTFKMINVIPQFHTINSGNWKLMEEWARNPINTPAQVCSGAFPWVLQLRDTSGDLREIYLRDNLIPVPLWTYKIVLNRHGVRTVFLQYNNIHDRQMPPQIPNGICQITSCPSTINLAKSNYVGYTYCCNPDHFMATAVPNLKRYC